MLSPVINLAIIESSRTFGDVLTARLAAEDDMRVLRSATSPAALWQAMNRSAIDVVVCDAAMFDVDGADHGAATAGRAQAGPREATGSEGARLSPTPAVVLLADYRDRGLLYSAIRSGVRAWVPLDASADDLVAAIRAASDGGTWIPPRILTEVLEELTAPPPADDPSRNPLAGLTPRERDVLACLGDGLGRADVAAQLHVSTNTVRTHVQSILAKLDVGSSVAAVALYRKASPTSAGARHPRPASHGPLGRGR
jgi:DNA-binding NarL/FixJ family response regulator